LTGVLPAHRVATPVLERLRGGEVAGTLLGVSATAAWVDLGGFVVAVTTREVPLLPNAVGLAAGAGALGGAGAGGGAVRWSAGRGEVGGVRVVWDPADPPGWDPRVAVGEGRPGPHPSSATYSRSGGAPAGPFRPSSAGSCGLGAAQASAAPSGLGRAGGALAGGAEVLAGPQIGAVEVGRRGAAVPAGPVVGAAEVGRRGAAVLAAAGVLAAREPREVVRGLAGVGLATVAEPEGAVGVELLLRAVRDGDAGVGAEAAGLLLGRGPGLTPEGDDLLAAVAGTLVVLGPVVGVDRAVLGELVGALVDARGRTTALAATLLELAGRGLLAEPAGRLLDLSAEGERGWPSALRRLERVGHGSGRAYALGIGAAAWMLAGVGGVG
jgi:hypothetical protein